jgi:hypothetical protein
LGESPPNGKPPGREPGQVTPVAMVIGLASLILFAAVAFSVCQSIQSTPPLTP